MHVPTRRLDYDRIAHEYDQRYRQNDYRGVERTLARFVGSSTGLVLEVGCGTGHWLAFLAERGARVIGLDPAREMLEQARARGFAGQLIRSTAECLPLADGSVERVFVVNAAHHFADVVAFIREARRVLTNGGELMIIGLDPSVGIDRWYVYEYFDGALEADKQRYPSMATLVARMRDIGFVRCSVDEAQHMPIRVDATQALANGQLARSATSQLTMLSDELYARGLRRIERDAAEAAAHGKIHELVADLRLYAVVGAAPG